jgi:hypothetical protein
MDRWKEKSKKPSQSQKPLRSSQEIGEVSASTIDGDKTILEEGSEEQESDG